MTSQAAIIEALSGNDWLTTAEIARRIPYTCRDFSTHRGDTYTKLRIMFKRGAVRKQMVGNLCLWRLPE